MKLELYNHNVKSFENISFLAFFSFSPFLVFYAIQTLDNTCQGLNASEFMQRQES